MRILVLTLQRKRYEAVNNFLIPRSLFNLGHEVVLGDVDTLAFIRNRVTVRAGKFEGGKVGDDHPQMTECISCEDFDLVWLLEYSHPSREREFFQLLWVLERRVLFVNRPSSIFFINNKIGVLGLRSASNFAPSYVTKSESEIRDVICAHAKEDWVLKPPNLGCGAGVFLLRNGDPNMVALIQNATGNAYQKYEMHTREAYGQAEEYTLLQRYIPTMADTENRVIVAGGKVVGGYKKTPTGSEFRGNYAVGGRESALDISDEAIELCEEAGRELQDYGINYVGIDLAFPYFVEFNLVNPGGISGQLNATGIDIGRAACEAVLEGVFRDSNSFEGSK